MQFKRGQYDVHGYRFIETEGTFMATLDLKVWGKCLLRNYLTLEDGRKIIACTFNGDNYYGMADIPMGSIVELTFKKAATSDNIYIRGAKLKKQAQYE